MIDKMHKIDFTVPLSGSKLFDTLAYATAVRVTSKFPGLDFDYEDKDIRIHGELNDMWFNKWNNAVFYELGAI